MLDFIVSIDKAILEFIQTYIQSSLLDKTMTFISKLGNLGFIWLTISIILILNKKYRRAGILAIYSLIISLILGEVLLKNIIQRARPFIHIPNIDLLITRPTSYSFPSGHTSSSFAALGAFAEIIDNKKIIIPLLALAFLMAFSRMYLMVHYPTDILGGIVLGIVSSKIAYKYCLRKDRL
ncbi:MAG: phosphatase PAP2 family protein [Clostridia bacterium]|nr:phosphatase PAP2 family protein [Clostridia bacterium]